MMIVREDALFPEVGRLDENYHVFMSSARSEIDEQISTKCSNFSFNFFKGAPFADKQQTRFQWPDFQDEDPPEPVLAYQGRASMASMDTLSTFPSADPESEIPEIPFNLLGRQSFTNEDIVNELPEVPEEEGIGGVLRLPAEHRSSPGSIPFGRQV